MWAKNLISFIEKERTQLEEIQKARAEKVAIRLGDLWSKHELENLQAEYQLKLELNGPTLL